jgi:hypothetical protein
MNRLALSDDRMELTIAMGTGAAPRCDLHALTASPQST